MSDIQLLEQYKLWDTQAFWKIYDKYIDGIYRFVYLKVSSKEIAEDIVSEAFFKCLNALEKFEPKFESALKSWIYTIAYNLVKDYYRTNKEEINIDEVFNIWVQENFWGTLDNKEKILEVLDFLQNIKDDQREVLIMRIWNDLSYKEIASITGKSESNCKKIVSRVLKDINANLAIFILLMML